MTKVQNDRIPDPRAKAVADAVSDYLNHGGNVHDLAEELHRDHRTLIQLKTHVVYDFLKLLAQDFTRGDFDLRNEQSVTIAHRMIGAVGVGTDVGFPYI